MKWTSWLGAAVLLGLVSFVVWSSFRIAGVRCETCIEFEGRRACREVEGASEEEFDVVVGSGRMWRGIGARTSTARR